MLRCKCARIDLGLSQAQLGDRAELNASEICLIERGRLIPRSDQLKRLAKALGLPAERLLDHVSANSLGPGAEARDAQRESRS